MTHPTSGFSNRYLAQVEAERQYVVHQLEGMEGDFQGKSPNSVSGVAVPLAARVKSMPTLEEAYLSVFAENRRKASWNSLPLP